MPVQVYSTQFLLEEAFSGPATYVVPEGFVAVIRDIEASVGATLGSSIQLIVNGCSLYGAFSGVTTERTWYRWEGRIVVEFGQAFSLAPAGTWDAYVGGYLLSLP